MKRLVLTSAILGAMAFAMVPSVAQASMCPDVDLQPSASNVAQVSAATLCLLNEQRAAEGLKPLTRQGDLDRASAAYAALMVEQRFFDHVSPDGHTLSYRLRSTNYIPTAAGWEWTVGENIGWAEYFLATPAQMMKAWMASPSHRENILSENYAEVGIGIVPKTPLSAAIGATYVTDFGRRTYHEAPVVDTPITSSPIGRAAISRTGLQVRILLDRRIKLQLSVRRLAAPGLSAHDLGTKTITGRPGSNKVTIKRLQGHQITTGRYRVTIKAKGAGVIRKTITVRY